MSKQQWGHGYHKGYDAGLSWGEISGEGSSELQYGSLADRVELLARALRAEANGPIKSGAWWAAYAAIIAKELHGIAARLPSALAALSEQPDHSTEPQP